MPTDTYQEESKGISRVWYVSIESIPSKREIRLHPETFEVIKGKIQRNGTELNARSIPKRTNTYITCIYSVYGARVLIQEIILTPKCNCPQHITPQSYLTITARDIETLEKVTNSLNLPLVNKPKLNLELML